METRNVEVSLAKAKEWYNSKNSALKEVALQAFTEEELKAADYKAIRSIEDACNALGLDYSKVVNQASNMSKIHPQSANIYLLDIVRRALNGGHNFSLSHGKVYIPWVRIYKEGDVPDSGTLKSRKWEKTHSFTHEGESYILVGGGYNDYGDCGVGNYCGGYGNVNANAGLLCCKSEEIARHMSKYFSELIFKAVYAQHNFVSWKHDWFC